MRRFVVHEHSGYGPTHYDLMLSCGEALATWQTASAPFGVVQGDRLEARKLADHREAYLTYQGPVSGDRGRVRILDSGKYRLIRQNEDSWEVEFHGRRLAGRWAISRCTETPETWLLQRLESTTQ